MENLYERVGLTPKIGYEVADEIMIIGIVSRGLGIGVIPQMLGTEYRKVTALEIENFEAQRTMYMIWPQNLYRPRWWKLSGNLFFRRRNISSF